jgi:hypothetical protein
LHSEVTLGVTVTEEGSLGTTVIEGRSLEVTAEERSLSLNAAEDSRDPAT